MRTNIFSTIPLPTLSKPSKMLIKVAWYIFVFYLLIMQFLTTGGRIFVPLRFSSSIDTNLQECPSPTPEPSTTNLKRKESKQVISPNGEFVASFVATPKENGTYSVSLEIYPSSNKTIWSSETEFPDIYSANLYINNPTKFIAWSPTNNKLAYLTSSEVVVLKYSAREEGSGIAQLKYFETSSSDSYSYPSSYDQYHNIFFSSNGSQLYFQSREIIYSVYPTITPINDPLFPVISATSIPGSSGFAYWSRTQDRDLSIILDFGNYERTYPFPPKDFIIDYLYEIILSPDRLNACARWGSSGIGKTTIFHLTSGKVYNEVPSCIKWLNNDEVIIIDSHGAYYLYDINTGERILITLK